jgi:brefeldin A-resistance guanine nucleotide exchange factor 1
MWKPDREILDTCCESITNTISKFLVGYRQNLQTHLGWISSALHLLSVSGRHSEAYEQGVETLITMMSDPKHV